MCAEGDSVTFGESRTCGVCAMFVCWPAVIKMQQAAAQIVVAAVVSALISLNMQITCTGLVLVLLPPPPPSNASTKLYHHPLYPVIASANTLTNAPLTEFKHLSLCRGPGTRCAMFSLAVGILPCRLSLRWKLCAQVLNNKCRTMWHKRTPTQVSKYTHSTKNYGNRSNRFYKFENISEFNNRFLVVTRF